MEQLAFDLTPYRQRWIAVVRTRVVGVGQTPDQAFRAAKEVRRKERPQLYYVDAGGNAFYQPAGLNRWFEHSRLLKKIAQFFEAEQITGYLVGGAVRDGLLDRFDARADLDLVVPDEALTVARSLANHLSTAYYPVDPKRQVGRIVFEDQSHIDIANIRGQSLVEDLTLRDFTINAIALTLDLNCPTIIDPLGGQTDLAARRLRAVSPDALRNDPLRGVRAVRLAAQFGFQIMAETLRWISMQATGLGQVSPERLRDEWLKLLRLVDAGAAVDQLRHLGLLTEILPEAMSMIDVPQSPPHHLPVYEHTLESIRWIAHLALDDQRLDFLHPWREGLAAYLQTEVAGNLSIAGLMPVMALLHDIGKPATFNQGRDGRIRFWQHPKVGAEMAQAILQRWRFSTQATNLIVAVVRHHMQPLLLAHQPSSTKRAIHRFLVNTGQAAPAIALLSLADHLATYPPHTDQAAWQQLTEVVFKICRAYFTPKPPHLLTGHEVMTHLNLKPGPMVGQVMRALQEAQAIGEVNDQAEALDFIKRVRLK